ncbi:MAG: autotransporter-associated beta strand repeat-containing protein [Verrucomicrobia bacterium]|nr:autotransporter-associated beta strand repeat-containing protein [Verrucomicrobiota bacterium]
MKHKPSDSLALRISPVAVVCVLIGGISQFSTGATKTWTSNGTGGADWTLGDNWNGDTAPVAGDALVFNSPTSGGTRTMNNDFAAGTSFASMTFNASAFVVNGNMIALGASGVSAPFYGATLNAELSISNSATQFTIAGTGSNRTTLSSVVSGTGGFFKTGAGELRIQTNAKTYSGDTTVNAGTLDLNLVNVLPYGAGKGNLLVNSGAYVWMRYGLNVNGLSDGASGGGTIQSVTSGTKTLTVGNGDAGGSFSGAIINGTGAVALTKTGTGIQVLSGTSTYTGATLVSGGSLYVNGSLANTSSLTVSSGAKLGGDGSIANGVSLTGGTVAPGLGGTVDRSLTVGSLAGTSGTLSFVIDGESAYDSLTSSGSINLANLGLSVTMNDNTWDLLNPGETWGNSSVYTIISGTTTNMFSGLTTEDLSAFSAAGATASEYTTELGGQKFWVRQGSVSLVPLGAIPEPGVSLLGAAGIFALLRRRRG